ncbi:hypothetical protein AC623_15865 [Bacillus sp. FJAT-27231]|uniref:heterodisulfide reductase-related iron-sulfur binding cluster n=1 Tax=Bacillus sp. FJAT-27231 TaxID=1679168 RepID=UPI000670AFDE|nr:hypothetical protein AC623_15865 [Bacillus sp. FJAT-27231]
MTKHFYKEGGRMKGSLFITCLVDMFYANVGKDMVQVLERGGCQLSFPEGQVCCGQPAYNSRYVEDSKAREPAAKTMSLLNFW